MNPYPYVLNNPLKYVDPLGLNPDRMLIMVDDGGGSKSTPAPIVNTKPKQNVVNQVKEEIVKKETSGTSDWSCKVTYSTNDKSNYQYLILYDPIHEEEIENRLREKYEKSSLFGKGIVKIKAMGHAISKRYRLAKAELQKNIYEQTGMDPIVAGDALDASVAYVAGEVTVGSISRGYKSFKEIGNSEKSFEIDLQLFGKRDLKMVDDAARQVGVDRKAFGEFIHEIKQELRMKPNENFSYQELLKYAEELKKWIGK